MNGVSYQMHFIATRKQQTIGKHLWHLVMHTYLAELLVAAELLVDEGSEFASGLAAAVGLHAIPVESVVVALCGVVEQPLVLAVGVSEDGDDVLALEFGAGHHGVGGGHVLGVVLVVVDAEGLLAEVGLQGGVVVRQRRKLHTGLE